MTIIANRLIFIEDDYNYPETYSVYIKDEKANQRVCIATVEFHEEYYKLYMLLSEDRVSIESEKFKYINEDCGNIDYLLRLEDYIIFKYNNSLAREDEKEKDV